MRGSEAANAHLRECSACTDWVLASERLAQAVRGLRRLAAPVLLEARMTAELGGDRRQRIERVLSSLVRLRAPSEVDERVESLFAHEHATSDEELEQGKAQVLRTLDVHPAPDVLDRLLEEELAAPARHRAERFPGRLERLKAPHALERRIRSSVRRNAVVRLMLGPIVTLAAAGLVLWFTVRHGGEKQRYRFQVVEATSEDALSPLARSLARALGGAGDPGGPK